MMNLTLNHIRHSTNIENAVVFFNTEYVYPESNYRILCTTRISYPSALRMLKGLGYSVQARSLKHRVKELSPQADEVNNKLKTMVTNEGKYKEFMEHLLGPNLAGFSLKLVGERYEYDPCDQYLCELTARENSGEYTSPTSDQFLKHAAKYLAKFQEPYTRDEFLAIPKDLENLYLMHTGLVDVCLPKKYDPKKTTETIEILEKYIASESHSQNVKMRIVNTEDLADKFILSKDSGYSDVLLELTIDDQVRYLRYVYGTTPFRFLNPINVN
jgi:hypothetical protein